jgi:hypothetical protein
MVDNYCVFDGECAEDEEEKRRKKRKRKGRCCLFVG